VYADLPHAIRRGWPTWVAPDGLAAVDAQWADALTRCGLGQRPALPRLHVLGGPALRCKLVALRAYRTQIAALQEMAFAPLERILRYEVVWELARA
jgi:hypothetical protein